MMSKSHHFFLLSASPWPLVSSFMAFNVFFSIMNLLKFGEPMSFLLSLGIISVTSMAWWLGFSNEFSITGSETLTLESGVKFSMILFISSEVFFFFSFFWSYFHFFLSPTLELGMSWPPVEVEMFSFLNVPLINTLVLLSSGITVTISHHFMISGYMKNFNLYLLLTVSLGFIFTSLQVVEYLSSFFSVSDSTFGTTFFILTGFHGIHVLVGTIYLALVLVRSVSFSNLDMECLSFELASWYWHFVDVVWIFLYFCIYYLNN